MFFYSDNLIAGAQPYQAQDETEETRGMTAQELAMTTQEQIDRLILFILFRFVFNSIIFRTRRIPSATSWQPSLHKETSTRN